MNRLPALKMLLVLAFAASPVFAAPAGAPAGSTGLCKDGSYYSGAVKKGACRGHQGVKDWWGAEGAAPAAASASTPAVTSAPATAPTPAPAAAPAQTARVAAPAVTQAPGGGAGQVWVNSNSKVYHCAGDKWYGKTKSGSYMPEADAKAKGFHPDHGKPCQ